MPVEEDKLVPYILEASLLSKKDIEDAYETSYHGQGSLKGVRYRSVFLNRHLYSAIVPGSMQALPWLYLALLHSTMALLGCVIRTASDDSCGGGLGTRLPPSLTRCW